MLAESVNKRELIFYHGTRSDPFDRFNASHAAKGEQFWNPLGNGMYVTDSPQFAASFGHQVHQVVIPAGCHYKRINQRSWRSMAFGLVTRALRRAFRLAGQNYTEWEAGAAGKFPKKLDREQMIGQIRKYFEGRKIDDFEQRLMAASDEQLRGELARIETMLPRRIDLAKRKKIQNFRYETYRQLDNNSPYVGLYETSAIIGMEFGHDIAEHFEDVLPKLSTEMFGKYDFVVFTETNDVIGLGPKGGSALEVVIFNPALQKTVKSGE